MENKTALVTGGASGLGLAIARRLAADGASVVISDISHEPGQRTAADLGVAFVEQDVTAEDQWPQVIAEVEALHGPLAILVNNAGIAGPPTPSPPRTPGSPTGSRSSRSTWTACSSAAGPASPRCGGRAADRS